jgi:hypothetical protein
MPQYVPVARREARKRKRAAALELPRQLLGQNAYLIKFIY